MVVVTCFIVNLFLYKLHQKDIMFLVIIACLQISKVYSNGLVFVQYVITCIRTRRFRKQKSYKRIKLHCFELSECKSGLMRLFLSWMIWYIFIFRSMILLKTLFTHDSRDIHNVFHNLFDLFWNISIKMT